jgi:hypothetical protein
MSQNHKKNCAAASDPLPRILICLGVAALLFLVAFARLSHSAELIPQIGITRSVESDEANTSIGMALRGNLVSNFVQTELATSYRSETLYDGDLELKTWPITASLLWAPVPALYAGAGVGWYHTTYEYAPSVSADDKTTQDFGVHVGGGLRVPLAPAMAVDLGGRYVFMQDQESALVPSKFDPDFWTLSAGLAIGF